MDVGKNIRHYRKKARLTQKQLAEMSNLAEITIRKQERGLITPTTNNLIAIAKALGITQQELINPIPLTTGEKIAKATALEVQITDVVSENRKSEQLINVNNIDVRKMKNSDLLKLRRMAQDELDRRWYEPYQ